MASNDSDAVLDFTLVRTYVPGMLLLVRGILYLSLYLFLVTSMSLFHVRNAHQLPRMDLLLVFLGFTAYFDSWYFRHDALSRAAGGLFPLLLALFASSDYLYPPTLPCSDMPSVILYYAASIAWAASSSFCVVNMLLRLQSFNINVAAILWGALALVLLYVDCKKKSILELASRSVLFYCLAILLWFSQTFQPDLDRNRFAFSVLHTCLHVLFVDIYVVIASVLIWIVFLMYYNNTNREKIRTSQAPAPVPQTNLHDNLLTTFHATKSSAPVKTTLPSTTATHESEMDLLRQLEAAKRERHHLTMTLP